MATTYRTCPVSGLQFEDQAEKLMRWNAVAGVTDYTVELATDAGFTQIVQSPTVAATSVNMSSLTGSATYHWRVIANGTCLSAPSTARSFTVETSLFSDGFESGSLSAWSRSFGN